MGGDTLQSRRVLPAQASSVPAARRALRAWLVEAGCEELADDAELAVSEVVTNALVHAGTPVELSARMDVGFVRVEVADGSTHLPRKHDFSDSSGTGRGLKLLEQSVDRWGAERRGAGKVVWFELGTHAGEPAPDRSEPPPASEQDTLVVQLLDVPLLLTAAWLEHTGALLREHLLMTLDEHDTDGALRRHAAASEAVALLEEQWPELDLGVASEGLLAGLVEPLVTADRLELTVPRSRVEGFTVLSQLLDEALVPADRGETLTPPTQPEVRAMRRWLTGQVREQAAGAPPRPLRVPGDLEVTRAPVEWDASGVDAAATALVAADDTDKIVAVSAPAAELLRYDRRALVGRRLLTIIPERYHQAHLAGFTMHQVNGRSVLLGKPVVVPVARGDGTERSVELTVHVERQPHGRAVYVAELRPPD